MVPEEPPVLSSGLGGALNTVIDAESGSKSERAYAVLKDRILSGSYSPGHRLVLSRIAEDLGVSVVPVREAIRRLEAEQLLRFERNVGATVIGIDPVEYFNTMQTLSIVEAAATALSLPSLGVEEIAEAHRLNEAMKESLANLDPVRFTALNHDFHQVLYRQCPNPHLLDLVNRGWNRLNALRSSTFNYIPGRAAQSVQEHDELLRLIENKASADDVERAARAHRTTTLYAYLQTAPKETI
ncbi:DNA-binding GntR family transcriptional regulator [Psychromicrobium silvestre]|uniref:DNA-binding GntR family transcriptional regulator n=1 Tax=Psychromicrobium silvestre TaxID=1645614 RepID=A0A7Y9LSD6_9MICC|nr:GntR family transcriptional regulator [Psychromicrobium silvestre]NYE94720.1 DNA-binding GntR family transcriptional regulator [Psychromicrobium silvestre]